MTAGQSVERVVNRSDSIRAALGKTVCVGGENVYEVAIVMMDSDVYERRALDMKTAADALEPRQPTVVR